MQRFCGQGTKTGRNSRPGQRGIAWSYSAAIEAVKCWVGNWRRSEDGVSAIEFALLAPVLFFALVAAVDVGLAEYERMTIDHVLRAGAQSAMADPGQAQVLNVAQNTASKNFTISTQSGISATALNVDVQRFCACPNSTGTAVACSTICAGSAPPFIYYRLTGTKLHNGMVMPAMTLTGSVEVQVR
jgi:pilus assembly protein CpaE